MPINLKLSLIFLFPFFIFVVHKNMKKGKKKINRVIEKNLNDMGFIVIRKSDIERIKEKYIMIGMERYFNLYMKGGKGE